MKTTEASDTQETPKPAAARKPPRKPSKPDAVLAAAVETARAGLLEVVPEEQIGEWLSAVPDADRLVTHRFRANRPGYRGWEWFATVARVPRGKAATVCEVGLLPSADAVLAPEWVPWSMRVRPEDVAAQEAEKEQGAAASETVAEEETAGTPAAAEDE